MLKGVPKKNSCGSRGGHGTGWCSLWALIPIIMFNLTYALLKVNCKRFLLKKRILISQHIKNRSLYFNYIVFTSIHAKFQVDIISNSPCAGSIFRKSTFFPFYRFLAHGLLDKIETSNFLVKLIMDV